MQQANTNAGMMLIKRYGPNKQHKSLVVGRYSLIVNARCTMLRCSWQAKNPLSIVTKKVTLTAKHLPSCHLFRGLQSPCMSPNLIFQ